MSIGGLTQGGRFDGSQVFIDEGYVAYAGDRFRWIAGQQTEPFSLENDMSGLATTFMERALPNALTPGNSIGLSLSTILGSWFLDTGIFGKDLAGARDISNQGFGWSGRVVFVPQVDGEKVFHLGASLSWRGLFELIDDNHSFIRSRPEVGLTDVRYVDTGDLPEISRITRMGLEGAFMVGPLSIQGEYIRTFLSRTAPYGDAAFEGWYAYVSWFPFGGSRKYSRQKALFSLSRHPILLGPLRSGGPLQSAQSKRRVGSGRERTECDLGSQLVSDAQTAAHGQLCPGLQ